MDFNTGFLTSLSSQAVSDANTSKLRDTLSSISSASGGKKAEASTDEEKKLLDACRQFESYFVEQMYKQMMATVPKDELDTGSNSMLVDYYKDNLVKEYAKATTDQENLGLAQMLYEQMKRNIGQTPEEIDAAASAIRSAAKDDSESAGEAGEETADRTE